MSRSIGSSRRCFLQGAAAFGAGVAISTTSGTLAGAVTAPTIEKVDVVVVGSGLAGLTAALAAVENGAKVVLLEKERTIGGNSLLATGSLYVGGTSMQRSAGMTDTPDAFYKTALDAQRRSQGPA